MVAQHRDRAIAERAHPAQAAERVRAAIDQVADEPQPVPFGSEVQPLEQLLELVQAAVQVADGPGRHAVRLPPARTVA